MTLSEETTTWLTTLPSPSFLLDETPLFGYCPTFPFEEFSKELQAQFSFKTLIVEPGELKVRAPEQFLEGMGKPSLKKVAIAPLESAITFICSEEDVKHLFRQMVHDGEGADEEYVHAFDLFITANILSALQKIRFDNSLSYHILDEGTLPNESALCQDVTVAIDNKNIFARLIIPNAFLQSWREKFSARRLDTLLQRALAKKIDTTLHFEAGKVMLKTKELKSIKRGDFVVLDQCYLNPGDYSGRVLITLDGKPLFRGKLKDDGIKIYEYPFYQEERAPMKDEDTEWEEEEEEEEDEDEDEEFEEEEEESEIEEEEVETPVEKEVKAEAPPKKTQDLVPLEEILVEVTVELGRLRLPLQKLLELEIGNHLELSLKKEDAVDLVVNGKCFAKAELLALGDTLGVRILDI